MKHKNQVIAFLKNIEKPICDDCLSKHARIIPRQTVYQNCTSLKNEGVINRDQGVCPMCGKFKIVSWLPKLKVEHIEENQETKHHTEASKPEQHPWYWEGNIQAQLVKYLAGNGYSIRSVADTASRSQGKDIIALSPEGNVLWVSVKGYPERSPNTQARHWFSSAIFDLILYRDENPKVILALGFPDEFTTYIGLASRTTWLRDNLPFTIYWVKVDGTVRVD